MTHPTHAFVETSEGKRCNGCDARPSHASEPCPEFVDTARRIVREAAYALFMSMPVAPTTAGELGAATSEVCRGALDAGREWALDAQLRVSTCRALAQLLGVPVDVDASLIAMSRA